MEVSSRSGIIRPLKVSGAPVCLLQVINIQNR
jgi:hypothetical protein